MSKIELNNLCKNYGSTTALKDVSLSFENKKIYCLLGRNGAGKSTMLNVISSRIFPTSGEVLINDCKLDEIQPQINNVYLIR